MSAVRTLLHLLTSGPDTEDAARRRADTRSGDAPPPPGLRRRMLVETFVLDGRRVVTVRPRTGGAAAEMIYLHGGAYVHGIIRPQWDLVEDLVRRTGGTVTVPLYRLAPQATVSTELPLVRRVHDIVAGSATGRVVLVGDSAGGGLALALARNLRDTGGRQADALVLIAPWVDVTMTHPRIPGLDPLDPLLGPVGLAWCGRAWAGDLDPSDPSVSPARDHLRDLPPIEIHQGDRDLLLADAEDLADRAAAAGTACTLHVYPGGFHVFPVVTRLPESRLALGRAARTIRGRPGDRAPADGPPSPPGMPTGRR